jgi:Zn-dependent M28 family amino/carboxypeptidase
MKSDIKARMIYFFLSVAILLLIPGGVSQQKAGSRENTALPGVSSERIIQDIKYLSSDLLEGRGTGEPGGEKAAGYIAKSFAEAGLAPAGDDGSFMQRFSVVVQAGLGADNELSVLHQDGRQVYRLDEDFRPLSFSESGAVSAGIVFAGYGISAEEYGYDDYEGIDPEGKIVLVMRHEPAETDENSPFDGTSLTHFSELRYKAMNARQHGAAGIVLFTDPLNHPDSGRDLLEFDPREGRSSVGIPCVQLSAAEAAELIKATGNDVSEMQARIDRELRPQSFPLPGVEMSMAVEISRESRPTCNVLGALPGSDPALSAERIVIGAHFDHLGRKGEEIFHGADDNASGTAALMELARVLASGGSRPARSILFAAFTGEELGLLGSSFMVNAVAGAQGSASDAEPPAARADVSHRAPGAGGATVGGGSQEGETESSPQSVQGEAPARAGSGGKGEPTLAGAARPFEAMVNMDMIGRLRDDKVYVGGAESSKVFKPLLDELAGHYGIELEYSEPAYGASDHTSFYAKGVPVLLFFTGAHTDHHKPSDTWDKINAEGEARVASLVGELVLALASYPDSIPFEREPAGAGSPYRGEGYGGYSRAYLGIVPDFTEGGEGLKLAGVSEGSPAEAAGLKGGDVMVSFDGRTVKDLRDLSYLLKEKKAGDTVEIVVLRGGEELTFHTVLGSREGAR